MRFFTIIPTFVISLRLSCAAPISQLSQQTITVAGGDVPNGGPAVKLSTNGISNFQLFAQALTNLVSDSAFTTPGSDGVSVQDVVTKVAAQVSKACSCCWAISPHTAPNLQILLELFVTKIIYLNIMLTLYQELVHKATIEGALTSSGALTIPECTKVEIVSSTAQFLTRANIITSTSIGAIISLSGSLAQSDPSLVSTASSILGVEARQDGFFRVSESLVPDPAPFETQISGIWAYNIVLSFVDQKSCPTLLPLPILPVLTITSPPPDAIPTAVPPTTISFTVDRSIITRNEKLFIGWVNQANVPVYTVATISILGKGTAPIPSGLSGASFAALTNQNTAVSVDALTSATIAGPAVVIVS